MIGYGIVQSFAPRLLGRGGVPTSTRSTRRDVGARPRRRSGAIALAVAVDIATTAAVVGGLIVFGVVFAMNSSLHSYLILAYSHDDEVSLDVGFYYSANAAGRLVGTLLSGVLYLWGGLSCTVGIGRLRGRHMAADAAPPARCLRREPVDRRRSVDDASVTRMGRPHGPAARRRRCGALVDCWTGSCRCGSARRWCWASCSGGVPELDDWLDKVKIDTVSLPIAIGLLLMMYPVLAKVRYGRSAASATAIADDVSLVLNWVIGPALMFALAWLFLRTCPSTAPG